MRVRALAQVPEVSRLRLQENWGLLSLVIVRCLVLALFAMPRLDVMAADDPNIPALEQAYQLNIVPLMRQYCHDCHAGDEAEAEVDLAALESMADVRQHPRIWQKVDEMLASGQMPPKDVNQPTPAERTRLRRWVREYLTVEARARAGDPGRVVLRRLSNAEYTYTLRDLTGIDSLDPAREFPIDGAAGEGFTNTGDALVMSPPLITKYLDAAKEVASHAVLLPDGIRFSAHATRRDWTDESLQRVRKFYRQFTDSHGGSTVNLQGIEFDTNQGGRLPLDRYLAATLSERDALTRGSQTIDEVARQHGLNTKYLRALWQMLTSDEAGPSKAKLDSGLDTGPDAATKPTESKSALASQPTKRESFLLDQLRAHWRTAKAGEASVLAAEIARWQQALFKFNSVGHIGREGSPKGWLERVDPLVARQEFKLQLPESTDGKDVVLHLVASDAGDGNDADFVIWKSARLEGGGQPALFLRDVAGLKERLEEVQPDARFGKHPRGHAMDAADLVVQAPAVLEFRVPAELAQGRELVVTGQLESGHGREGSVQLRVLMTKPDDLGLSPEMPIVVSEASPKRDRVASALEDFRSLFPAALCYTKIVPVDEVVTLTLFYREDDHLQRLMLDNAQIARLNRLWDELLFVGHAPLALVNSYEQITEFATQDRPDLVIAFQPLRKPINDRADAFRQRLVNTEPTHVDAVLSFAHRAWRRPLTDEEQQSLRRLYRDLRASEMTHDEAIRLTIARVLASPAFLYRLEQPASGNKAAPISDAELANRLSYFLWSSLPDEELRAAAQAGLLTHSRRRGRDADSNDEQPVLTLGIGSNEHAELLRQTRRMLKDKRTRRLAIEFACQWLHIRGFDQNNEKNETLYPDFSELRDAMYEESVRFFEHMFRNDGSIMGLLDADHTFLNHTLAKHYGIPWQSSRQIPSAAAVARTRSEPVTSDSEWRRVDGIRESGRGGVLAMATVLAKQSGASRTSPILRGNWVSETLLGERLPRPPANVPQLPELVPADLTARQLIERHSSVPACAKCHARIDPYGFALEQYDAIGRLRPQAMNTKTTLLDGTAIEGIEGLREYLRKDRHDDVVGQFCRKLLGYSLGRETQLSDQPLFVEMQRRLETNGYRFSVAVEAIVTSRQFREIRGTENAVEDAGTVGH